MPRLTAFLLSFGVSLVTGCAVGPNYHTPKIPTPEGYAEAVGAAAPASAPAGAGRDCAGGGPCGLVACAEGSGARLAGRARR